MNKAKKQRKLKGGTMDKFTVNVSEDVGKAIRKNAAERELSLSAYIGLIVESYLEEHGLLSQ